jgi:hypothetical protein
LTIENGNGELKQLLEIKRTYRKDLEEREAQLRAEYERELAGARKELREKYLENVVDVVFAEPTSQKPVVEAEAGAPSVTFEAKAETEPPPKPAGVVVLARECPECAAPVRPEDKFCSRCAFPLKESEKPAESVAIAGRKLRPRRS